MTNNMYYKQSSIWKSNADDYQVQVLSDLLDLIPEDVQSILDVGCGDGHITNKLPDHLHVVGMDISEEALKKLEKEKVVGDIANMPFPDNSFDLIMINDVLEHIPDEIYSKALSELERVSKKYIIVTVPHNEQLTSNQTKCKKCSTEYHIHWHQRSYTEADFTNFFSNKWSLGEIRYSGTTTLPPYDTTVDLKKNLNLYKFWSGAVCPNCGEKEQIFDQESLPYEKIIKAARHRDWFGNNTFTRNNRSEIMTLFQKSFMPSYNRKQRNDIAIEIRESLEVNFKNPLQRQQDFFEGDDWPRYKLDEKLTLNENGVQNLTGNPIEIPVRLPVVPKSRDRLIASVFGLNESDCIAVYAIDGVSQNSQLLFESIVNSGSQNIEIPINYSWTADKFGLPISIYLYGNITLSSLVYEPISKEQDTKIPFLKLQTGHNVLVSKEYGQYIRSWGLAVPDSGLIPYPKWIDSLDNQQLDLDQFSTDFGINKSILREITVSNEFINLKNSNLSKLIEEKEHSRNHVESLYQLLEIENQNLNKLIIEKEHSRKQFELENQKLSFEKDLYSTKLKTVSVRKVQKVLILSHMFPNIHNPLSGSFVHEQVKALRENENIDVRVISCQPYWMNGFNIKKILNANRYYPQEITKLKWTEYDGVPVIYPPYRVGSPLLPFHLHGWSYKSAVMKMIDEVWKVFKFDLIHAHTSYLDGTAARFVSEKFNVPYVITEHTGPFTYLTGRPLVKQLTLKSIEKADKVWAVSDALSNEIKSYFSNKKIHEKIDVLYNGVSTEKFYAATKETGTRKDVIDILFVGFLEDVKNPFNLINAFEIVCKELDNIRLKIVGDGTLFTPIKDLIKEKSLQEKILLLGRKDRSEIAQIMRNECDIFVLPSKVETFGVVLIEAIASGKPIIATKCGGPESIIKEAFIGELCENDSVEDLAKAMKKVIGNLDYYEAGKIRQYAIENFDFKTISYRLSELYQLI